MEVNVSPKEAKTAGIVVDGSINPQLGLLKQSVN